jgi:predicted nucleic acid-binding protein
MFLDLALAAAAPVLVSGDADLLALKEVVVPCRSSTLPAFRLGWRSEYRHLVFR